MKQIKLTQGKVAIVDNEDFERLNKYKWYANYMHKYWYVVRNIKKNKGKQKTEFMHRVIMNVPDYLEIDHINHNGLDNRRCNLRVCTRSENNMNRRPRKGTSSYYKGVCWDKRSKKWIVRIQSNKKCIYLGCFNNEIVAAHFYDMKAKKLFGEFAYLNFKEKK